MLLTARPFFYYRYTEFAVNRVTSPIAMAQPLIFIDGAASDCLTSLDRGFSYGHGVFETMRLYNGQLPLLALHLERLEKGLERLGIKLAASNIKEQLAALLVQMPASGVVKLTVTAGVGPRGYRPPAVASPTVIVHWNPLPSFSASVSLQQCRYRLPSNPALAGIKHLNRLDQVLAAMELEGDRQGLLLDQDDNVVEAISHNIFMRFNGGWQTPRLDHCGVAGVMRHYLLDTLFPVEGLAAEESLIPCGRVVEAEEIFICNAVSGITPVTEIAGMRSWQLQSHTAMLQHRLEENMPCFVA